jgi:cytoskeleton protein RodZ
MIEELDSLEQNYGPGNVLRGKREEYEWSVEAVAEALHLSTNSVKAIEADRYDDLPGETYVIGYWRSYARLLGIDIEETIEANKRNLKVVVPESSGYDINEGYRRKKSAGFLLPLLLIAALGGAAYYVWQQQFFGWFDKVQLFSSNEPALNAGLDENNDAVDAEPAIKETQVLRPLENVEAQNAAIQLPASDNALANSGQGTLADSNSAQLTQEADLVLKPLEQDQTSVEPTDMQSTNAGLGNLQQGLVLPSNDANQTVEQANSILQGQSSGSEMGVATTQAVDSAGTLASTGGESQVTDKSTDVAIVDKSTLILSLSKDSWLDVRDKTNKRLLYRTETAGNQIKVKGTPPFYIYIGTPSGVKIKYQGKNVPFETHKSGLFARFKLGDTLESL